MELLSVSSPYSSKLALRKQIFADLRQYDDNARHAAGLAVAEHIAAWMVAQPLGAKGVALFSSLASEVDTAPLSEFLASQNVRRFLPLWQANDLSMHFVDVDSGQHVAAHEIGLLVVPGLAFDAAGNRLGRGKGYYDRFLSSLTGLPSRPVTMGIAMDCQLLQEIPVDSHDQSVDMTCTPTLGIISTSK